MAAVSVQPKKRKYSRQALAEQRWGFLFISPWIVGIIGFTLFPLALSLYWSFFDYNPIVQAVGIFPKLSTFIGFGNWVNIFYDDRIRQSVIVTLRFIGIVVPFMIMFSLALAMILGSTKLKFQSVWTTAFFLPQLIPFVSTGLMWNWMLNTRGPINEFLRASHLSDLLTAIGDKTGLAIFNSAADPGWLNDQIWVMPAIAIVQSYAAGYGMLQFMAALRAVPKELYEAAKIDGAGHVQSFFTVSLPLISSVIFYNVLTGIITGFQYFTIAFLLYQGNGGPGDSALFYSLLLFKEAIKYFNMGYAAAMAWAMLVVVLILTQVLFALQRRYVFFATEER